MPIMTDNEFKRLVWATNFHESVNYCMQCNRCTENCPVHEQTDAYNPRQNILNAFLGVNNITEDNRLGIYGCTMCDTCDEVCPVKIPLTHIFQLFKNLAAARNISPDSFKGEGKAVHDAGASIPISPPIARKRGQMGLPEGYTLPVEEVQAIMQATGFETMLGNLTIEPKKKGAGEEEA
jgi:heterodisulfide reductase subunit C